MHYAALLSEARVDQEKSGWAPDLKADFNWQTLVQNVQMHIKGLNWGYKADMMKLKVKYYNSYATFVDPHTIKLDNGKGKVDQVTAEKIVIAVGGRPNYPGIPGDKEFGITSDDMFSLKKPPGKTLVVGASYIALECAGFLTAFGYDTTVMVRSILLRGFDQDLANRIGKYMADHHTKFIHEAVPTKLEKPDPEGKIRVTFTQAGEEKVDEYDTVLFAVGRYAVTEGLNLEAAGLVAEKNAKFKVDECETTNIPHIYAIGDVIYGQLELTPVAIKAGALLAKRLFEGGTERMDYVNVPTTVFSPLEYGCVGYAEAEAQEKFGAENISCYHTGFQPLEWQFNKYRPEGESCYVKVICNKQDNLRVIGYHLLAPNAGEVTQGIAVAIKCGVTKEQLDSTVGIHPTVAEESVGLKYTKEDNPDAKKSGC